MTQASIIQVPIGPELVIIVAVIVLLFGANRIPKLARSTGKALGEFKRGREEIEEELREEAEPVQEAKEDMGEVKMEIGDEVEEAKGEVDEAVDETVETVKE